MAGRTQFLAFYRPEVLISTRHLTQLLQAPAFLFMLLPPCSDQRQHIESFLHLNFLCALPLLYSSGRSWCKFSALKALFDETSCQILVFTPRISAYHKNPIQISSPTENLRCSLVHFFLQTFSHSLFAHTPLLKPSSR